MKQWWPQLFCYSMYQNLQWSDLQDNWYPIKFELQAFIIEISPDILPKKISKWTWKFGMADPMDPFCREPASQVDFWYNGAFMQNVIPCDFFIMYTGYLCQSYVIMLCNHRYGIWKANMTDLFPTPTAASAVNTLRPRQNGHHLPNYILRCIFLNGNEWVLIQISLKCIAKGPINNIPSLVQIMDWRLVGAKPLSEPMMVSSLMHTCPTQPQWVNPRGWVMMSNSWLYFVSLR